MRKQDPSVKGLPMTEITIDEQIQSIFLQRRFINDKTGKVEEVITYPVIATDKFAVVCQEPINPDKNGDFLFNPETNTIEFDTLNTFAIVYQTIKMYEDMHKEIKGNTFNWGFGNDRLFVFPKAGHKTSAFYKESKKLLKFFHFPWIEDGRYKKTVYTCQSQDVVAHETGHAILDGIKPQYNNSSNLQTQGLHESFGDLSAIFLLLSQKDMRERIIKDSDGNISNDTFLNLLAEEFGIALGETALRNANNKLKLSEVKQEEHEISVVFTGAIYDILTWNYNEKIKDAIDFTPNGKYDPITSAKKLEESSREIFKIMLTAFINAPKEDATFADIANNMLKLTTKNKELTRIIIKAFSSREIKLDLPEKTASQQHSAFENAFYTLFMLQNNETNKARNANYYQSSSSDEDNYFFHQRYSSRRR